MDFQRKKDSFSRADCLNLLSEEEEWWFYYAEALRTKIAHSKNRIRLNALLNAKSGLCNEDCGYCAQSKKNTAEVQTYGLLSKEEILRKAEIAKKNHASVFCIATSGKRPTRKELLILGETVQEIKKKMTMEVCLSVGLVTDEQIAYLKECGIDRLNHNLNTSKENYPSITTTHTYQDRLDTLEKIRSHGLDRCSGFICGMGETDQQLVQLAFDLKEQAPYSVPINFLLPIKGTAFEKQNHLTPLKCLKVLTMMRLLFPTTELRVSAGREFHLGELQPFAMLIVDSIFLGDYLTEKGASVWQDQQMLKVLGLVIEGACHE